MIQLPKRNDSILSGIIYIVTFILFSPTLTMTIEPDRILVAMDAIPSWLFALPTCLPSIVYMLTLFPSSIPSIVMNPLFAFKDKRVLVYVSQKNFPNSALKCDRCSASLYLVSWTDRLLV